MGFEIKGITGLNAAEELGVFNGAKGGPVLFSVKSRDDVDVVMSFLRRKDLVENRLPLASDTLVTRGLTGYNRDGSTATFSGQLLAPPIAPGTLSVEKTVGAPAVKDFNKDEILWLDGAARTQGSGGSFAAMAAESLSVKVDKQTVAQTMLFTTEGTIDAAVARINSELKGVLAVKIDANNVSLESKTTGPLSAIEISALDAGVGTKLGLALATETTKVGTLDYFTGALEMVYPGGYSPSAGDADGVAEHTGSNSAPFDFEPADTLVVNTNAGGNETATFDAAEAVATGASGSFAAMSSETMSVTVDGGETVTVTFGTEATIELAVQLINEQLGGGFCDQVDADNARITSDQRGTGAAVVLASVAAGITTKLGLANGTSNGTGDVANINAVTVAEIKTVVEADTTGLTVTDVGGKVKLSAVTSLQVSATSDVETILGLNTVLHTVTAGDANLKADWVKSVLVLGKTTKTLELQNLQTNEEVVIFGAGKDSKALVEVKALEL